VIGHSETTEAWGLGLYWRTDAVQCNGVPMSTVARWLERRPHGAREDLVTFYEFATLLFVRQLRKR
jgi:hypothetical protein